MEEESKEKKSTTHENSLSQQATQQKYETDEFQNIHELIEIEKKRLEKEITELEYLYNKKQEEMNRTYQSQKEEQKTSSDKEESIIEKKEDKRAKRESERIGTETLWVRLSFQMTALTLTRSGRNGQTFILKCLVLTRIAVI